MRKVIKFIAAILILSIAVYGMIYLNNISFSGNDEIQIIDNYQSISSLEELLKNPRFRDKALYIDIWGVYCRPCIEEFDYIVDLKEKFRDKPVEFIYLASPYLRFNDVERWKSGMKKYDLKGHNMLMSPEFYKGIWTEIPEMKEPFVIPHYLIVDRNGKVVNPNAPAPSSGELVFNEISEAL